MYYIKNVYKNVLYKNVYKMYYIKNHNKIITKSKQNV